MGWLKSRHPATSFTYSSFASFASYALVTPVSMLLVVAAAWVVCTCVAIVMVIKRAAAQVDAKEAAIQAYLQWSELRMNELGTKETELRTKEADLRARKNSLANQVKEWCCNEGSLREKTIDLDARAAALDTKETRLDAEWASLIERETRMHTVWATLCEREAKVFQREALLKKLRL